MWLEVRVWLDALPAKRAAMAGASRSSTATCANAMHDWPCTHKNKLCQGAQNVTLKAQTRSKMCFR